MIMRLLVTILALAPAHGFSTAAVLPPCAVGGIALRRSTCARLYLAPKDGAAANAGSFGASISKPPISASAMDTAIAAVGAGVAVWSLSALEAATGVPFYAPPLAASTIIIFAGPKPPPARNVFLGTVGATTAAVAITSLLGDGDVARSVAVGACLVWFKTTGAVFPPACALAALVFDSERIHSLGWSFVLCPALSGNAVLYGVAAALAPLRTQVRLSMEIEGLRLAGDYDRTALKALFDRFDNK